MAAAKMSVMEQLHEAFATILKEKLQDKETLTAGDLSVIRQFLKDNGINATEDNKGLSALQKGLEDLPEFGEHPFN